MKLSLNWLKNYIDPKLSTEALTTRLVMAGWEVEAQEQVGSDTVLELEITPNRPDCLNIIGLAREIGAITSRKVRYPKIKAHAATNNKIPVIVADKKDCARYVATLIKDVTVKDSPQDIKDNLQSLGLRPISNAVDVTNFVLMELGQPLHVFDYDKIVGGRITVRRAKQNEKITTIDGVERSLDPTVLVIADEQKAIAIAGIMGGKDTEVTETTKNILLESAHFDMTLVRRASRKLGLRSDSSYRFERNVNFDGVLNGANRATDLLLSLTQGKLMARTDIAATHKTTKKAIKITEADVYNRLGVKVDILKIKNILKNLDFKVTGSGKSLSVNPPSFRADVKETVDLIEEVARIIGFDHMPTSMPQVKAKNIIVTNSPFKAKQLIRQTMMASGLSETVTLSMLSAKDIEKCMLQDVKTLRVYNPLSSEQEFKRPSLFPSLMNVALTNFNRGQRDLRLFEIGKRYSHDGEHENLAILMTGRRHYDWRASRRETIEIYDLKSVIENLTKLLKVDLEIKTSQNSILDENCCANIYFNQQVIGFAGRVKKQILNNWEIKNQDIYFASIHLEEILSLPKSIKKYEAIAEYPAVSRDISLAVKKDVSYQSIQDICRQHSGSILKDIQFIEQYVGDKVAADQKALVFSLVYQSNSSTLREEEVSSVHERIVQALIKDLGATRR